MSSPIEVSIILPAFNEAGHIEQEIDRIHTSMSAAGLTFEIIVVDDGSSDGTSELLAGRRDIRLYRFPLNRGSGSSRRFGTQIAQGEIVVWTDADMTYPNDRIPELVAELDGWDQVVGARTSEEGTRKALRVPAKWLIRRLASFLSETRIPDLNSGFRAFRRSVALQFLGLLPAGFSCVTTLTMAFLHNGYTVHYTPIEYAPRAGTSKFHWYSDTRRYLRQVIRLTLMYNPLRMFGPTAALVGLGGTVKLAYDLLTKDFRVATNTLAALAAAGTILLIGLLADVIVQTAKARALVPSAAVEITGDHPADS